MQVEGDKILKRTLNRPDFGNNKKRKTDHNPDSSDLMLLTGEKIEQAATSCLPKSPRKRHTQLSTNRNPLFSSQSSQKHFHSPLHNLDHLPLDSFTGISSFLDLQSLERLSLLNKTASRLAIAAAINLTNAGRIKWPLKGFSKFAHDHGGNLKRIDFTTFENTVLMYLQQKEYVSALSECKALNSVVLIDLKLNEESFQAIHNNRLLESLSIVELSDLSSTQLKTLVSGLNHLNKISLSHCFLSSDTSAIDILMVLDEFPLILDIEMRDFHISNINKLILNEKKEAPTNLHLINCALKEDDLEILKNAYRVTVEIQAGRPIPTAPRKVLLAPKKTPFAPEKRAKLRRFNLEGSDVKNAFFRDL